MCQDYAAERDFVIWMETRAFENGHRLGCIGLLCDCLTQQADVTPESPKEKSLPVRR